MFWSPGERESVKDLTFEELLFTKQWRKSSWRTSANTDEYMPPLIHIDFFPIFWHALQFYSWISWAFYASLAIQKPRILPAQVLLAQTLPNSNRNLKRRGRQRTDEQPHREISGGHFAEFHAVQFDHTAKLYMEWKIVTEQMSKTCSNLYKPVSNPTKSKNFEIWACNDKA